MKKAKYFLCFMLILCSFVLSGELYQHYLNTNFLYGVYSFQIKGAKGEDDIVFKERHAKVKELSDDNECSVFCYAISLSEGKLVRTVTIYADSKTSDLVMNKCNLKPGMTESLFLGSTDFIFENFDNANCIANMNYYFLGETENINTIRESLVNKGYSCSNLDANTYRESFDWILILLWIAFTVILIVFTWIDVQFKKKENLILVSLGKPTYKIILNSIIIDTAIILAIYSGLYIILSNFTDLSYLRHITLLIFIGSLLLNIIITILMMSGLNIRKALSRIKVSNTALASCYVIKTVSIIVTIVILTLNIVQFKENLDVIKQEENLQSFDGYNYLSIVRENELDYVSDESFIRKIKATIFFDKYRKGEVKFSYRVASSYDNIPETMIIDKNDINLLNTIDEVNDLNLTKDLYVLLPDNLSSKEQKIATENAVDLSEVSLGIYSRKAEYEVINYKGDQEIFTFNNDSGKDAVVNFNTLINPVIILCNLSEKVMPEIELHKSSNHLFVSDSSGTLYKFTEEDISYYSELFGLNKKGYQIVLTDATERNNYSMNNITRLLTVNIIMSVFMILFELAMIVTIVRLEYMSNSIEMSLKKVLGYSLMKRNRSIFSLYTFGVFIGVLITTISAWILKLDVLNIILYISGVILLAEYITMTHYILNLEKIGVAKILKGGCL